MPPSFANRVVLVTGASRGIGRAIAQAFGASGARVVVHYRTEREGAEETARLVCQGGGTATMIAADLAEPTAIEQLVLQVEAELGPPDVLVNNAATVLRTSALETPLEEWDRLFAINCRAVFLLSQLVARGMVERGRGAIVNISSVHSQLPVEFRSHYAASKAAVNLLTKVMALEVARQGVRVNAVAPGLVDTDMTKARMADPNVRAQFHHYLPQGRLARPEEIADAVLFLASDEASYINGHILVVDGALTSRQSIPKL